MKTYQKAALSLLLCAFVAIPQAALAGKPGKPAPSDCDFQNYDPAPACNTKLMTAYSELETNRASFVSKRSDQNYFGLRCKVVSALNKMVQDKPVDAEKNLADSVFKIATLYQKGKIDDAQAATDMQDAMEAARACAEAEIYK